MPLPKIPAGPRITVQPKSSMLQFPTDIHERAMGALEQFFDSKPNVTALQALLAKWVSEKATHLDQYTRMLKDFLGLEAPLSLMVSFPPVVVLPNKGESKEYLLSLLKFGIETPAVPSAMVALLLIKTRQQFLEGFFRYADDENPIKWLNVEYARYFAKKEAELTESEKKQWTAELTRLQELTVYILENYFLVVQHVHGRVLCPQNAAALPYIVAESNGVQIRFPYAINVTSISDTFLQELFNLFAYMVAVADFLVRAEHRRFHSQQALDEFIITICRGDFLELTAMGKLQLYTANFCFHLLNLFLEKFNAKTDRQTNFYIHFMEKQSNRLPSRLRDIYVNRFNVLLFFNNAVCLQLQHQSGIVPQSAMSLFCRITPVLKMVSMHIAVRVYLSARQVKSITVPCYGDFRAWLLQGVSLFFPEDFSLNMLEQYHPAFVADQFLAGKLPDSIDGIIEVYIEVLRFFYYVGRDNELIRSLLEFFSAKIEAVGGANVRVSMLPPTDQMFAIYEELARVSHSSSQPPVPTAQGLVFTIIKLAIFEREYTEHLNPSFLVCETELEFSGAISELIKLSCQSFNLSLFFQMIFTQFSMPEDKESAQEIHRQVAACIHGCIPPLVGFVYEWISNKCYKAESIGKVLFVIFFLGMASEYIKKNKSLVVEDRLNFVYLLLQIIHSGNMAAVQSQFDSFYRKIQTPVECGYLTHGSLFHLPVARFSVDGADDHMSFLTRDPKLSVHAAHHHLDTIVRNAMEGLLWPEMTLAISAPHDRAWFDMLHTSGVQKYLGLNKKRYVGIPTTGIENLFDALHARFVSKVALPLLEPAKEIEGKSSTTAAEHRSSQQVPRQTSAGQIENVAALPTVVVSAEDLITSMPDTERREEGEYSNLGDEAEFTEVVRLKKTGGKNNASSESEQPSRPKRDKIQNAAKGDPAITSKQHRIQAPASAPVPSEPQSVLAPRWGVKHIELPTDMSEHSKPSVGSSAQANAIETDSPAAGGNTAATSPTTPSSPAQERVASATAIEVKPVDPLNSTESTKPSKAVPLNPTAAPFQPGASGLFGRSAQQNQLISSALITQETRDVSPGDNHPIIGYAQILVLAPITGYGPDGSYAIEPRFCSMLEEYYCEAEGRETGWRPR